MIVVTNNEKVRDSYPSVEWVEGPVSSVMNRVEEMLCQGYSLVSCPMSANNRLNRSPYRSIIVDRKSSWSGDDLALVDNARAHFDNQGTVIDRSVDEDYSWIDADLLKTAWEEGRRYGFA